MCTRRLGTLHTVRRLSVKADFHSEHVFCQQAKPTRLEDNFQLLHKQPDLGEFKLVQVVRQRSDHGGIFAVRFQ